MPDFYTPEQTDARLRDQHQRELELLRVIACHAAVLCSMSEEDKDIRTNKAFVRITELRQLRRALAALGAHEDRADLDALHYVIDGDPHSPAFETRDARIAELEEALRFYREPQRYIPNDPRSMTQHECIQEQDKGACARAALLPPHHPQQ